MKRIVSALLVVMLVMTGLYISKIPEEVKAASTGVDTEMLQVKAQVASDGSNVMRFVTSVDSLDYNRVGFEVQYQDGAGLVTKTWDTQTVFEKIVSEEEAVKYQFSPKVVAKTAEYFVTAKMRVAADVDYTVRAYVVTRAGEKIFGDSRCVGMADAGEKVINVSVDTALSTATTYSATYDGTNATSVSVLTSEEGKSNVRIVLADNVVSLPSATKVVIKNGSTEVANVVYRNYYSTYGTSGRADTTWYTVNPNATEFVIASNADLWGFATLTNGTANIFKGKTVTLVRDVTVNEGKVVVSGNGTTTADFTWQGDTTNWPKIGVSAGINFNGTFDGDGNVISGVYANYYNPAGNHTGLFGYLGEGALIKNFTLKNSFIDGDYNTGGIVGVCKGNLESIYVDSDTCVKMQDAGDYQAAGMIGIVDTLGKTISIRNCWFNGIIANNGFRTAGMIARIYQGTVSMEDCLVTGKVISTKTGTDPKVGGFVGGVDTSGDLVMVDCLDASDIYVASADTVSGIVGRVQASRSVSLESVYTTNHRANNGDFEATFTADTYTGIGSNSAVALKGIGFVVTAEQLAGENGYVNTALDFVDLYNAEGTWVATANGPELKAFSTATPITEFDSYRTTLGWYYKEYVNGKAPTEATSYEIDNADALFGLAQLVNNSTDVFAGDMVTLTKNIDVNPGWVAGATLSEGGRNWTPIGSNYGGGNAFKGTFDGAKHTIGGIYVNANAQNTGLFGDLGGVAKNFVLSNSYIKNQSNLTGAIAGRLSVGRIENVYVDSTVTVEGTSILGGVVGRMGYDKSNRADRISNVRFDGTVIGTTQVGGILGQTWYASTDKIILDNCMFNGIIETTDFKVGGLIGHNDDASTIQYCLSMGTIRTPYGSNLGMVVGHKASEVTAVDCYGIKNLYTVDGTTARNDVHADKYTAVTEAALRSDARATVPELFNTSKTTSWAVDTNGMPTLKWMTE